MSAQMGEFRISWIISTVPLMQFLCNAVFFKTRMRAMRVIGGMIYFHISCFFMLGNVALILMVTPTYAVFTTTEPTTLIFGLSTCKWGILALLGDPFIVSLTSATSESIKTYWCEASETNRAITFLPCQALVTHLESSALDGALEQKRLNQFCWWWWWRRLWSWTS